MSRVETLTAYMLKFSYLQRNNPLIEDHRDAIREGLSPTYTLNDFISDYLTATEQLVIGKNADRAIKLSSDTKQEVMLPNGVTRTYLSPQAGKQGKPVTVIKPSTQREYNFGADSAALYGYHLFLYDNTDAPIAIFHRQNGSGCKSVFLETANNILRLKGLKLEMELYIPLSESFSDSVATKITLQYTIPSTSSDVADNYSNRRKKPKIVRELGLNLEMTDNNPVANIIKNMQLGSINQEVAFAQIKAWLPDSDDYNDAEIQVRLGKQKKKIKWNEFESAFGALDITAELHSQYELSNDYLGSLTGIADNYFDSIIESGGFSDVE